MTYRRHIGSNRCQGQWQQMAFSCKNVLVEVQQQIARIGEQQEQILESFREHETVHGIVVLVGPDVRDSGESARYSRVRLKALENFPTDAQIVVITGCFVQKIRGLQKLGPQRMVAPVYLRFCQIIKKIIAR